jgi:hypothetical protein
VAVLLSFSNTNNMFVSSLSSYYTICIVQMVSVMTSRGLQWDGPNPLPNIIVCGKSKQYVRSKIQGNYVLAVRLKGYFILPNRSLRFEFYQFTPSKLNAKCIIPPPYL